VQEIRRVEDLSEKERVERLEEEARAKFVSANQKALDKAFLSLADPEEDDQITDEGVEKMCTDLGIDPEDPVVLVISWHMRAENMCVYTKEEFMRGMAQMQCKDLGKVKQKIPELSEELHDMEVFDAVYSWVYDFCKDSNKKSLQLDYAKAMWKVMLEGRWDLIGDWLSFLEDTKYDNPVKRDEWSMLRLFMDTVREVQPLVDGTALQDDDVPWPVLIDEFVDYMEEKYKGK
jgi:DCN1-like protein 1/2